MTPRRCGGLPGAAEQGNAEAESNLGDMYLTGSGVAQDYAEAAQWYRRAAEQGYAPAQFDLGRMYLDARGFRKTTFGRMAG